LPRGPARAERTRASAHRSDGFSKRVRCVQSVFSDVRKEPGIGRRRVELRTGTMPVAAGRSRSPGALQAGGRVFEPRTAHSCRQRVGESVRRADSPSRSPSRTWPGEPKRRIRGRRPAVTHVRTPARGLLAPGVWADLAKCTAQPVRFAPMSYGWHLYPSARRTPVGKNRPAAWLAEDHSRLRSQSSARSGVSIAETSKQH